MLLKHPSLEPVSRAVGWITGSESLPSRKPQELRGAFPGGACGQCLNLLVSKQISVELNPEPHESLLETWQEVCSDKGERRASMGKSGKC